MNIPEATPVHRSYEHLHFNLDVLKMSKEEKLDWLANHALALEHKYLRQIHGLPQIAPEGKIQFLTGGKLKDVTKAIDFDGFPIHTRYITKPKDPSPKLGEIPEALGEISNWFEKYAENNGRHIPAPSKIAPMNEIGDIIFCLANLTSLDKSAPLAYTQYMEEIASSLGVPLDKLLTITVLKYNYRLGQGKSQKNHQIEDQILASFLESAKNPDGSPYIREPTNEQLHSTFHTLSGIDNLLVNRVHDLKQLRDLGIAPYTNKSS
ncbi:MAG: hypothetical protein AAB492_04325 [Patescibacteria group bacterium]